MEYIIRLKLLGDIFLYKAGGEVLYVLRNNRWYRRYKVVDGTGQKILDVRRKRWHLGNECDICSGDRVVGSVGSNCVVSQGHIEIADMPPVRCRYGWGFKSTMTLEAESGEVGRIELLSGIGTRSLLRIENSEFDVPSFLIACALIFRDWTSRG